MSQLADAPESPTSLSPVQWCEPLGRRMRLDGVETIGISTQTLAEGAMASGDWSVAEDLAAYFLDEMTRINEALFTWLEVIIAFPRGADGAQVEADAHSAWLVDAMRGFGPGDGDLAAVRAACQEKNLEVAAARLETMAVRVAAVHDQLVWWIQHLLAGLADARGEQAVCDAVLQTYDVLWSKRYATWHELTPLQRLQISVEGMRGHLSGPRHRGDVGVRDEGDRYVMSLDPCGSCGVLRRGDPDSGRPGCSPAGPAQAHDWAGGRTDIGWYAVHSAIVMEWLQVRQGQPPLRPLAGCDLAGPCLWFIYKDPDDTRAEHYEKLGFPAPQAATAEPTP